MKGKIINLQLDDSFYKEEIRDGYTVTTKQKKIWAVEMDLLDQLLKVCKKHDIKVIIYAGTLLGAIRHKGFIPWDDDIDVALTRPEYEKLLKVAPEEFKAPYFFQTALSDKECFVGYARLRNSLTTGLIAGTETPQYNCGIYIDVFVLDAYIEDSSKLHSQLKERHYWEIFINKFHYFKPSKSLLKRIIGNILHYTICKIVPYHFVIHLYNKTLTRYNGKTDRISLITHTECFALKYWCRLSDFHNIIEVPFENMIIPIPANYDEILKHMYGDYMTFPPAEKRGAWHEGILEFEPDIPYADFFKKKKT